MKSCKSIIFILVIFLKTGNVLSNENIFIVNNIELTKKANISNQDIANQAIKQGFERLTKKILLKRDIDRLSKLSFSQIKNLVSYYQVQDVNEGSKNNILSFNISFDKKKLHDLFYKINISYSEIVDKEIFLLPVYIKNDQVFIYSKNFFYEKWNLLYENNLIDFILPIENIEIIQKINLNKKNLLNINLRSLFPEYKNKNLALILIEDTGSKSEKIFIKTSILEKNIDKSVLIKRSNLGEEKYFEKIIKNVSEELVNLIKSQNLVDVRVPSFLNTKFKSNRKFNLVDLDERIKKIELIDYIYVQELSKDYVMIKIKYLGKLDKIIKQLEEQNVILKFINEEWRIKII